MPDNRPRQDPALTAHNRMKGKLCFHLSSAQSQLVILKGFLNQFQNSSYTSAEINHTKDLIESLQHIQSAVDRYSVQMRRKLEIGESNRPPNYRKPNSSYAKGK